jgi:branched-chain amino acid transport system ATP-binding protein
MTAKFLQVDNITMDFGGVRAVDSVSFSVEPGEIVALIGPNGAGKSTVLNMISGTIPPLQGEIYYEGKPLSKLKGFEYSGAGISRTFQNLQTFDDMTVLENVMVGLHARTKSELFSCGIKSPSARQEEQSMREQALEWLEFVGLAKLKDQLAGNLAYGKLKQMEIARAMVAKPKLLLLDEPAAGLNHSETLEMSKMFQKIKYLGTAILLVEHDMDMIMTIADRIIVLDQGKKIAEGTPGEIQANPRVIAAYIGEEKDEDPIQSSKKSSGQKTKEKTILSVKNVVARYGPVEVLHGIDMHVSEGEIVSLLGSNGAGKTTLLNCICGLHEAKSGTIEFNQQDISKIAAEKIVPMGMAHVPERRQIFSTLTVEDNLYLGASHRLSKGSSQQIENEIKEVYKLFPILEERKNQLGGTLSGGQQQMLAISRALLSRPSLLLLDEPSLGLAPLVGKEILEIVKRIRDEWGTTVLLVEQNARAALAISDRAYVLSTGKVLMHGSAEEIMKHPEIQSAYLGKSQKFVDDPEVQSADKVQV